MKKVFTTLLATFLLINLYSQQKHTIQFQLEGHLRECIIVTPSQPPPPDGWPMVFMLHGTSGDGEKFYNTSGWKELGEEENFVTVFPSSLSWCFVDDDSLQKFNTRWVNGSVIDHPCDVPQDYVDDVYFLKVVAGLIKDSLHINDARVFVCGFSNGCAMIHKLANEAGDVFAAAAGVGGVLPASDSSLPVKRIPLWSMIGSADDRFIVPPYTSLPYGGDSILAYLNKPLRRVLACQGLTEDFTYLETQGTHTYTFSEGLTAGDSKPYRFTLVKDMHHLFPNGNNHFLNAPRIFWEFFNQVSLSQKAITHIPESEILISPNPASDLISIELAEKEPAIAVIIRVFNSQGYLQYETGNIDQCKHSIDCSLWDEGVYLVSIQMKDRICTKKILVL